MFSTTTINTVDTMYAAKLSLLYQRAPAPLTPKSRCLTACAVGMFDMNSHKDSRGSRPD